MNHNIEIPGEVTREFINRVCAANGIKRNFVARKSEFRCNSEIILKKKLGRAFCIARSLPGGAHFSTIINKLKSTGFPYASVYLSAQSIGFADADEILTKNGFYPLVFSPMSINGQDLIEYQFLTSRQIEYIQESLLQKDDLAEYFATLKISELLSSSLSSNLSRFNTR